RIIRDGAGGAQFSLSCSAENRFQRTQETLPWTPSAFLNHLYPRGPCCARFRSVCGRHGNTIPKPPRKSPSAMVRTPTPDVIVPGQGHEVVLLTRLAHDSVDLSERLFGEKH